MQQWLNNPYPRNTNEFSIWEIFIEMILKVFLTKTGN